MHFTLMTLTICCTASFGAGFVDSIAGGGGLISLPVLMSMGLPPHLALGTNKCQAGVGTAASVRAFLRGGEITREWLKLLFFGGFVGGVLGACLVLLIDPKPLRIIVLCLLAAAACFMAVRPYLRVRVHKQEGRTTQVVGLSAFVIGIYDGFFGPGTGSFMIIALSTWAGDTLTRASGNTKVMNFGSNIASIIVFTIQGKVLWLIALPMSIANMFGQMLGARLAMRRGDGFIRFVILAVIAGLIVKVGFDVLR